MKITAKLVTVLSVITSSLALAGCVSPPKGGGTAAPAAPAPSAQGPAAYSGQVYLYGEIHGVAAILDREFELWRDCYQNKGMRHLFVEHAYFTAEFLNRWMQAADDAILLAVYADWEGTLSHNPYTLEFYRRIKRDCPQTVFHGTDVGHQYDSTGARYLRLLEAQGQTDTPRYRLAQAAVGQGSRYDRDRDSDYRENTMTANFARELEALGSGDVMGIYGAAHIRLAAAGQDGTFDCMATRLAARYGTAIHAEDLSGLKPPAAPERFDEISLGGRSYRAACFGKENISGFKDFATREFWRLEGAYDAVKALPRNGDYLPCGEYPVAVETGQVFRVTVTRTDGSLLHFWYRADGTTRQRQPVTEGFTPSE